MPEWELRDPWFLVLLPLVPIVFWLARRSASSLSYSSLSLVEGVKQSWRLRMSKLPALMLALATLGLVIALARPRTPERETRVSRDGIAIMMVIDLSSSMNARDMVEDDLTVNRLDVVKDVFGAFVLGGKAGELDGRLDDLVGLVTFAGYADSICPLTLDHGNLVNMVNDLQIVDVQSEDGTAVGDGLGLAVERLRRSKAKSRVAILLTDGVQNAGILSPEKAAELAAQFDVKVYCIGVGTNGVAPMPVRDIFGGTRLVGQPVNIDEEMLKQVAAKTSGEYFRAENLEGLAEIYASIDSLEKTEVTETRYLRYQEHFEYFVSASLGLMSLAAILQASVFRRLP